MTLPKQLQQQLNQKIINYEESKKMPLLSNIEKEALERIKLAEQIEARAEQIEARAAT